MSEIRVTEEPLPLSARHVGQIDPLCLSIDANGHRFAVMCAVETYHPTGRRGFHASISKSHGVQPVWIVKEDIALVIDVLRERGRRVPSCVITQFEAGPFAGLGIHLWEES